jgi:hypothetical protein
MSHCIFWQSNTFGTPHSNHHDAEPVRRGPSAATKLFIIFHLRLYGGGLFNRHHHVTPEKFATCEVIAQARREVPGPAQLGNE